MFSILNHLLNRLKNHLPTDFGKIHDSTFNRKKSNYQRNDRERKVERSIKKIVILHLLKSDPRKLPLRNQNSLYNNNCQNDLKYPMAEVLLQVCQITRFNC